MLTCFYIKNFRLFKELSIPKLSRVNLFVGKNNSGKTALLESLHIYIGNGSPEILISSLERREEYWNSNKDIESFLRHLFNGHDIPFLDDEGMILQATSQTTKTLKFSTYALIENKTDDVFTRKLVKSIDNENSTINYVLAIEKNDEIIDRIDLDNNILDFKTTRNRSRLIRKNKKTINEDSFNNVNYVSIEAIDKEAIARLWDSITLTELENEVVAGLKIIEPKIAGVVFVDSQTFGSRIPLVKIMGENERLPLKSMGDGIFRLFYIILSLVNSKNGYLLIDEFENGIHWSVQRKLWDIIFKLSDKLNVQIFATTHSSDCVSSFKECWGELSEDSATFYRVNSDADIYRIKRYGYELLDDSIDTDVEVR
jgi:AAA15 family ATPase/GTPase